MAKKKVTKKADEVVVAEVVEVPQAIEVSVKAVAGYLCPRCVKPMSSDGTGGYFCAPCKSPLFRIKSLCVMEG